MTIRRLPACLRSCLRPAAVSSALVLALVAAGCTTNAAEPGASGQGDPSEAATGASEPAVPEVRVDANVSDGAEGVPVDRVVEVTVSQGQLERVVVKGGGEVGRLDGELGDDGSTWQATDRLEPGHRYRLVAVASDQAGTEQRFRRTFRTQDLSLDEQTFPSIAPLDGETVGVGMPVVMQFDVPVTDRAAIERHLSVETQPEQRGSWSWLSDTEVHWRPRTYWKPGTQVTVNADINSVPAGGGVYGQLSRTVSFDVGDALISRIDVTKHRMRVFRNGQLIRTVPVTAGKDGFTTRSGVKVVMEKHRHKTMDARTIGIDPGDPEYYNLDVEYALRVTYSGEFVHGAPWSQGSQGSDNVSHGCVGMSMSDARWLFDLTRRGDVVVVTGTNRTMEPGNGYTDWNLTYEEFKEGSAL